MARYVDAIDLPIPVAEAFAYLADFSHTAEWDPGVVSAERLTRGALGSGSRFRVVVSFLGREVPFEYEITDYEEPSRLVVAGRGDGILSIDEITFVAREAGTRVTYEARVELQGLRRLADPLLDLLFQRVGRLATRGLRERIAERVRRTQRRRRGSDSRDARSRRRSKSVRREALGTEGG